MKRVDFHKIDVRLACTDNPVADLPVFLKCREHQDDTSSLAVYPNHIHCYGCGFTIKHQIDSLCYLLRVRTEVAYAIAWRYTNEALDAYREQATDLARTDPLPRGLADAYEQLLWGYRGDRVQWLTDRGLKPWMILSMKLGHDGTRFTIPFFDHTGRLITIRYRRDDAYGTETFDPSRGEDREIAKYSGMSGRNGLFLYPEFDQLQAPYDDWCVICEGEFDTMRLIQEDIPAYTTVNGAGNLYRILDLLPARIKRIVIAADQDEAGWAAAVNMLGQAGERGLLASRLIWPDEWGKDITDLYLSGHTLYDATEVGDAGFKATRAG